MGSKVRTRSQSGNILRPDIQGLRALAVTAVIFDHLLAWPSGGFVGVDIFFVISGFLITSLLLREEENTGTISFTRFYKRRIKRIMPAAFLVLLATTAAAFSIFNIGRATQTLWDSIWALFFGANWHFAAIGTDYFTAGGALSPVQHFWSLSVEEQFYFVWPWLMLLIYLMVSRFAQGNRTVARNIVGSILLVIVVGSFLWSLYETATAPTWSYFSTFSRAWELGVGALIAVVAPIFAAIPSQIRPVLGWIGLLGVISSIFLVADDSMFPAPWAALPVLSSALIIVAGTGGAQRFLWPLTNPFSRYLGDISYSLYLWHFPVIVFLSAIVPDNSGTFFVVAILGTLALSVFGYELVENPVRKSSWLEGRAARVQKKQERSFRVGPRNRRVKSFALGGLTLLTVCLVTGAFSLTAPRPTSDQPAEAVSDITNAPAGNPVEVSAQQKEIQASLSLEAWPELTPGLDVLAQSQVPEWKDDSCLDTDGSTGDRCVYGAGDKLAVLLGDSVAISYMPALRVALEADGWKVKSMTLGECPAIFISVMQGGVPHTKCDEHHQMVQQMLSSEAPDLIVLSSAENSLQRLASGATGQQALTEWGKTTRDTLSTLSAITPKTVLLAPPPQGKKLAECATQINAPSDCAADVSSRWTQLVKTESGSAEGFADPNHAVAYVDTLQWFCTPEGHCPAVYGSTPMRVDANHLTGAYSALLGAEMADALQEITTSSKTE